MKRPVNKIFVVSSIPILKVLYKIVIYMILFLLKRRRLFDIGNDNVIIFFKGCFSHQMYTFECLLFRFVKLEKINLILFLENLIFLEPKAQRLM